jgi:hypothetical protein
MDKVFKINTYIEFKISALIINSEKTTLIVINVGHRLQTQPTHLPLIPLITLNSVDLVCKRTIQNERPPLVGEVSAPLLRIEWCRVVSAADPLRP